MLKKMAEMEPCKKRGASGTALAGLIIAIIALILVIIIWIFYFLERDDFLRVFEPVWELSTVDSSAKTIAGKNFTLYVIPTTLSTGDTLTLNKPDDVKAGQWFAVTNLSDKAVKIAPGAGVSFESFPTTTPPPSLPATFTPPVISSESDLPGKTSWIIAWADGTGTALNLAPGGIKQS